MEILYPLNHTPGMDKKRLGLLQLTIILNGLLFFSLSFAQQQLPDLAQIKAAAEAGDATAQDRLGEAYYYRMNFSSAAGWFRKAAEQKVVHAQWRIGGILLNGMPNVGEGSVVVPADKDEGVKWLTVAANQGYTNAQLDLGRYYHEGKGPGTPDYPEAYKWYKVASQPNSFTEKVYLERLILKMTQPQIQEGEKRARSFVPGQGDVVMPSVADKIILKGISGAAGRRLAMINNQTFAKGDELEVKAGQKKVHVKCLEIKEKSVVLLIEGISQPQEIGMK